MTQMNLSTKQKQTHKHREQTSGCQGAQMGQEVGLSRCKLLHTELMSNTLLLHGTSCDRPGWKTWKRICMCNQVILQQKLTQHDRPATLQFKQKQEEQWAPWYFQRCAVSWVSFHCLSSMDPLNWLN